MPPQILIYLPYTAGGVTQFVVNLVENAPANSITYKVIFYRQKEANIADIEIPIKRFPFYIVEYSMFENTWAVIRRLAKFIDSPDDIIVANDGLELRMAAALRLPNRLIFIVHGDFQYYFDLAKIYYQIIDKIIVVSQYLFVKYTNQLTSNKIIRLYAPVPNILTQRYESEKFTITYVGFIDEQKGVLLWKDIFQKLHDVIDFRFNIIGIGDKLQIIAQQLSPYNIKIYGQLPNDKVLEILLQSHILLLTSYSEGLPLSVVEAMKAGCVPVVSDLPSGIPELIDDGINGFRVPVGDAKAFANAIIKLYHDRQLLNTLSQNARQKVSQMFDVHQQAMLYEQTFVSTDLQPKTFIKPPMGRVLNRRWLPNWFVLFIRRFLFLVNKFIKFKFLEKI